MGLWIALTAGTLATVLGDLRALRRQGINSLNAYIVRADIRSESLRLIKCLLCFIGLCAGTWWGWKYLSQFGASPIDFRNYVFDAVGALLGINSAADLWGRHFSPHGPRLRGKRQTRT
jgi:hypothetical protein